MLARQFALEYPHTTIFATAPAAFSASILALSVRQQVSAVADDQLLFLSDWKLATTSLAEALDSVIPSLQGRPRELASALAAKFIALARRDVPQQGPPRPSTAPQAHGTHCPPSELLRSRGPSPGPR
ncbi:hypothetical protein N7533_011743 [Penicillium manginii]|uniref:uncharacterized protein n=1 Tax=Penicillium manginii TaxID=203109 RepID=UPI002547C7B4|nr:uncharacterized protein N7533_011743 [Penicillium manginii]KAJ5742334.1 hypothetical protein N7533_011743 [Penicillium manginii]